jgi:hypothetical protein
MLKQWNLLQKGVTVSLYGKRQSNIVTYYSMDGDLVYCINIQELMEEMQLENTPEHRRLFTDSSQSISTMEISSFLSHWLTQFM